MVCHFYETEKVIISVGIERLHTSWIYKFNGIDFSLVALYIYVELFTAQCYLNCSPKKKSISMFLGEATRSIALLLMTSNQNSNLSGPV